jgi:branched-chain amino acid transport system substrate-binding protein
MKIGIVGPLTGPRSVYGQLFKQGVKRAGEQFPIDIGLLICDDAANPDQAEEVARYLISNRVRAVIGHFNSACALRAASLYRDSLTLFLAPASTHPNLTVVGQGLVFRFCPHDGQQAMAVAGFLQAKGIEQILVLYENTLYGQTLAAQFQIAWGKQSLILQKVLPDMLLSPAIFDIKAIFFIGTHFQSAALIKALRNGGYHGLYIASDDSKIEEFISLAQGAADSSYVLGFPETYEETSYKAACCIMHALTLNPMAQGWELAKTLQDSTPISFSVEGERLGLDWSIWQVYGDNFFQYNYS